MPLKDLIYNKSGNTRKGRFSHDNKFKTWHYCQFICLPLYKTDTSDESDLINVRGVLYLNTNLTCYEQLGLF